MSVLDSKAAFADRLKQLGIEDALKGELQDRGFETFGSLAFAVWPKTAGNDLHRAEQTARCLQIGYFQTCLQVDAVTFAATSCHVGSHLPLLKVEVGAQLILG